MEGKAPEVRALWVSRFEYKTAEDVKRIMEHAAAFHFNVVLWQVRGNATAFYNSSYEPWAWELTGSDPSTLGQDPGWDPLQVACDEAHARGLQLHAWVNVFPAWQRTVPPPDSAAHLWNTNRDWFMKDRDGEVMWPHDWWDYWYTFIDPGVPAVKEHLQNVFLEIVETYPVDGLHYDYVRYPNEVGDWAYNDSSVVRFEKHYKDAKGISPQAFPVQWAEWKRAQITEIVQSVYRESRRNRPNLIVTAAVLHDWPRAHNDYGQDGRTWLSRGIVDGTFPMLYTYTPEDFEFVVRDAVAHSYGRWVLPGLHAGRWSVEEYEAFIRISRELGAAGTGAFSYGALFREEEPTETAQALLAGPFARRVPVPKRPS